MAQLEFTEQEIAILGSVLDTAWRKARGRQTYFSGKNGAMTSNHPEMEAGMYKREAEVLKALRDKVDAAANDGKGKEPGGRYVDWGPEK